LTKDFILNNHVSWLFLPAGIRIMLILVFTYTGAIGLSIASLVIGFISNGMDLMNFGSETKLIVTGLVLLAAVSVDSVLRSKYRKRG
jgi:ABC-type xylose transport system permease subunit